MAKKKAHTELKAIGRWAPIGLIPVTEAWKIDNGLDEHLILLLDTATGEVHVRGDVSGVQVARGNDPAPVLVTSARKSARRSR